MTANWQARPLGDVLKLEYGKPLPEEERAENGAFPAYGANGVYCRTDKKYCDKPSIIVGRKGAAGELTLTEARFWPLDVTYYVTFDEGQHDLMFLYYALSSLELTRLAKGVKPGINRNDVYDIKFPFPPLSEQKRIVAILDEAFAGIAAATANAEKNLANARELFTSYVSTIFSSQEGDWTELPLGEVCENLDSRRIPITKSDRTEGDVPYYGASGIVDYVAEHIFDEDILLISEDGANLLARTYPVAFSVRGRCWVNNHAHVVRFTSMATQRLVEFYLNSISLAPYVSGMAQPKLNQKAMNSIIIPLPPQEDHARIVGQIEMIQEESKRLEDNYSQKLAALSELKQSILQKAFSGELTAEKARHCEAA